MMLLWVLTICSYPCFLGVLHSSSPNRERDDEASLCFIGP
jgi:hypothetical protein